MDKSLFDLFYRTENYHWWCLGRKEIIHSLLKNLVTLFDILEHIEDDRKGLKKVYDLLKDKGVLILTVPAYRFLWNDLDLMSGHKRRYISLNLKKVKRAGFKVLKISYFNSLLFPCGFGKKI